MNRVAAAFLVCVLAQSVAQADEPSPRRPGGQEERGTATLRRAITVEAARLTKSESALGRLSQSSQASKDGDTRHWCVRHGVRPPFLS